MTSENFDPVAYNRAAWDREVDQENEWTRPVEPDVIARARAGEWSVVLIGYQPVPRDWFPADLAGTAVLCLASGGNVLALSDHVRAEQVELDFPDDAGDARLTGLAGGEVAGFLGLAGAGPVRAVAGEGARGEDLEQERGKREIGLLRGKKPRPYRSRRPGHAGS